MQLRVLFDKLLKKQYVCWVCLDSECDKDEWIVHECGCNLQVHRKCLIGWIFDLNKSKLGSYYTYDTYKINTAEEVSRRMCYLIDKHRDMGREVGFAETVQMIPVVGQTWASFICVGDLMFRAFARLSAPDSSFSYDDLWRGLPQDIPPCPQCKQKLLKTTSALQYRSKSVILSLFALGRNVTRYTATLLTLHSYFFNPVKSLFKVGLWQLRTLFSESSLRKLLDISNTKALDVYADSFKGLLSLSSHKLCSIIGFPIYLFMVNGNGNMPIIIKIGFPYFFLQYAQGQRLLRNSITCHSIALGLHNLLVRPLINKIHNVWIQETKPYFLSKQILQQSRPSEDSTGSLIQGNVEASDLIIRSQWYDSLVAALAWPFICKWLGQKLFAYCPQINAWLLNKYPSSTPDECTMAHSLICSVILYISYGFVKLGITYLRMKEIKEVQSIVRLSNEPQAEPDATIIE
ncbi:hypothetical protein C6P41_004614 [Kluyveromyces marxianus]|nr:hypothetical protein C6P43_000174 [Kluyveromyces marxianus]KAG0681101.1 hypothetical protein C6P41_004614 [Kluyveromyces marxianus]